ncbi:ArgE/DapE family deacylase [Virgibacillus oceani]
MQNNMQTIVENWMNDNKDSLLDLLKKLVNFKSVNSKFMKNPSDSEVDKLQDFLEDYLKNLGLDTDKWDVYENQPNLVGVLKGNGKEENTLILNGHIDIVPSGDLSSWSYDPWKAEIDAGKMYGRGTCDMKAGVVSNIMVAKFLKDMGIELDSDLQLHIVTDEEAGGGGTKSAIERGYTGKGVIVTEPTDGIINPVEGGLEWVRIIVKGSTGHAGYRYSHIYPGYNESAVNVIEKSQVILNGVSNLEKEWSKKKFNNLLPPGITTISPGVMLAGAGENNGYPATTTNPAMVPDHCIIDFDLKYLPTENSSDVRKEFEEHIHNVCQSDEWLKANPPKIEWELYDLHFPAVNTSLDHKLVKFIEDSQSQLNVKTNFGGFVAVSDAAFYSGNNIPAVIYGPIGERLHGPDENVDVESIFEVTKVLILTVLQWYGVYSLNKNKYETL